MARQEQRLHLSLAGEHHVVAELRRRGIHATIAHGNVRQTDVVAFGGDRYVAVEVKTTRTGTSWPVTAVVGPRRVGVRQHPGLPHAAGRCPGAGVLRADA